MTDRTFTATPVNAITLCQLYNSNRTFLQHHLGVSEVSEDFIRQELEGMAEMGFLSELILDKATEKVLGFCDYKPGDCTYLSLLMLDGALKGQGIGAEVYRYMEERFLAQGAQTIRIDVVDDYEDHVLGFWEKQGFVRQEEITLEWNGNKLRAQMMKKELII